MQISNLQAYMYQIPFFYNCLELKFDSGMLMYFILRESLLFTMQTAQIREGLLKPVLLTSRVDVKFIDIGQCGPSKALNICPHICSDCL